MSKPERVADIIAQWRQVFPDVPVPLFVRQIQERAERRAKLKAEGRAEVYGGPLDGKDMPRTVVHFGTREGFYEFDRAADRYVFYHTRAA